MHNRVGGRRLSLATSTGAQIAMSIDAANCQPIGYLVKDALSDECYLMGRDADEGTSSYTEISIAGGGSLKVFDAAKRPQLDRRQFLPSLSLVRFALRTRRPSMTALRLSSSNPLVRGRSRVQLYPP